MIILLRRYKLAGHIVINHYQLRHITNMQTFTHEDLEDDILNDLLEEINELYEASEQTLIELELRPEDNELQRALFRSVHTIKGDLGLVSFHAHDPIASTCLKTCSITCVKAK